MQTDLTLFCHRCRLRLPAAMELCPECHDSNLVKARDWLDYKEKVAASKDDRKDGKIDWKSWAWNEESRFEVGCVLVFMFIFIIFGYVMLPGMTISACELSGCTSALVFALVAFVGGFVFALFGWFIGLTFSRLCRVLIGLPILLLSNTIPRKRRRFRVGTSDARRSGNPTVLGSVKGGELIEAPLSGEKCVAFRISGECDDYDIDDASMTNFLLEVSEVTEPVLIKAESAIVNLSLRKSNKIVRISSEKQLSDKAKDRLKKFLSFRGIILDSHCVLTERILKVGDRVAIWGELSEEASASGWETTFRKAPTISVLGGGSESPVVLEDL